MIDLLRANAAGIFSAASPFLIWLINFLMQPKAKLFQQSRHRYTYLINQPLLDPDGKVLAPVQTVTTASISIFNAGRAAATKLEVVFNWKPQNLNIWPSRHFEEKTSPDNRYHLFFDSLPSKDTVGMELLNINQDLPAIVTVRSEQCVAKVVELQPQPTHPKWKLIIVAALMAIGFAASVYSFIKLLSLLMLSAAGQT